MKVRNRLIPVSFSKSTTIRFFVAVMVLGIGVTIAQAQRMQPSQSDKRDEPDPFLNKPIVEMRARAAIRRSDKDYQENLDRAHEVARLSSELRQSFQLTTTLTETDQKKIERIEKLTKKIRSAAGGSDGDFTRDVPLNLGEAINMIASAADDLNKNVSATPKLVVSASVIEQTNQLLELVRYVRGSDR